MTRRSIKPRAGRGQTGFTLMEVLIAVAITAVIGLGVWQVISGVILSRDRVDEVAESFDQLQHTFLMIERDLNQVVNRPIRNVYGDTEPAFTTINDDFALLLTRQGWRNPLGARRSELQRVGYEFTGDELRRRYWLTLDQGQEDNSQDQRLLSNVEAFELRFLGADQKWVTQWPAEEALNNSGTSMPAGVEITLTHERYGELVRIFTLPNFDVGAAQQGLNEQRVIEEQNVPQEDEAETETETPSAGAVQ